MSLDILKEVIVEECERKKRALKCFEDNKEILEELKEDIIKLKRILKILEDKSYEFR